MKMRFALLGLFALALLVVSRPVVPAIATEPTPTVVPATDFPGPPDKPFNELCELALAISRAAINPEGIAADSTAPQVIFVNPFIDIRDVPTHSLVSATFDKDMDPSTITNEAFYVTQGAVRVGGSISYIAASRQAILHPDTPLTPGTTYTARVTTGVRALSGEHLAKDIVWTFTTADGISALGAGMNIYFGDLHSHSGYSDGQGTPAEAFTTARANGLDFFALTDHAEMLTFAEWQDVLDQANAASTDGEFIGLRGFEFTHSAGHLNVFNSDNYVSAYYYNLDEFYSWLVAQPAAVGQFNHPGENFNFDNFAYNEAADQKISLRELTTYNQFFLSLNNGWHLGTLANSDTHEANWGCCRLMGLLAPSLTKGDVLEALGARRTFFVTPFDRSLALVVQANGYWMGAVIPKRAVVNFVITAYDPSPTTSALELTLYDENYGAVSSITLPPNTPWTPSVVGPTSRYYFVGARDASWYLSAYSSPIWIDYSTPAAPSGLMATAVSRSQVNLSWTDNSHNEDGFKVERSPNGTSNWAQIATLGANVTTYSNTGLNPNMTYYYRIRAYNENGNSGYSNVASATTSAEDAYEPDDTFDVAKPIAVNWTAQQHNFHLAGDEDWVAFTVTASETYTITTKPEAGNDTVLELYDIDGTTVIASNEDCPGSVEASCINNWIAPGNGTYYVKVSNKSGAGDATGYSYELAIADSRFGKVHLPVVLKNSG